LYFLNQATSRQDFVILKDALIQNNWLDPTEAQRAQKASKLIKHVEEAKTMHLTCEQCAWKVCKMLNLQPFERDAGGCACLIRALDAASFSTLCSMAAEG